MKRKTGLFFGSFNPVHIGHMIIAEYMATRTDLDEVWMVVSPHNPHKDKKTLAPDYDRLHLLQLAVEDNDQLRASDIEFKLPKPSYTVDTLIYLREKYPERTFALIMGGDNLHSLHKWKNHETLIREYEIYVYNRPGFMSEDVKFEGATIRAFNAPLMHISASYIRDSIQKNYSVRYLLPEPVCDYLDKTQLYR